MPLWKFWQFFCFQLTPFTVYIWSTELKFEADDILNFIFFYFSEKTSLDFSCESSAQQTIHMKSQDLFSLKNKKKIKLLSAVGVCATYYLPRGRIMPTLAELLFYHFKEAGGAYCFWILPIFCHTFLVKKICPVSILRKSISGRHRPVRVADGPMTARCRFT